MLKNHRLISLARTRLRLLKARAALMLLDDTVTGSTTWFKRTYFSLPVAQAMHNSRVQLSDARDTMQWQQTKPASHEAHALLNHRQDSETEWTRDRYRNQRFR